MKATIHVSNYDASSSTEGLLQKIKISSGITMNRTSIREEPICKVKVVGKSQQIVIKKGTLDLNNNSILLLRSPRENIFWTAKVTSHGYSNYIRITSKLKERPSELEIIKVAKIGEKPKLKPVINKRIDIVKFLNDNWTCIPRLIDRVTIYKPPKGPDITILRFIELDEKLAWSMGFYLAEGNKCNYGIGVSNNKTNLLKKFQDSMEKHFGIQNIEWHVYIRSSNKNCKKFKEHLTHVFQTKQISVIKSKLANEHNVELRLNNTLFAIVFNRFILESIKLMLTNRLLTLAFLRGYEVGDGSVLQRNGYLYGVCITVKNEMIKNALKEGFQKLYDKKPRIRRTKKAYEICYSDIEMMTKLILDGHFRSHPNQWKKLVKSYTKKQYTSSHIKYWKAVETKPLSVKEISKITHSSHCAIRDALNKDVRLGLVSVERKHVPGKSPYHNFYFLTESGKGLLSSIGGVLNCEENKSDHHGRGWT